jgi:S-adenosylmethionine:tRNA ribosyltransferase-isomerase
MTDDGTLTNPQLGSRTADYDFTLPPELIAQRPSERRERSRLMVLERSTGEIQHRSFADLIELVAPGDVLVVNETRVFPARLRGVRTGGGSAEVLLLHPTAEGERRWTALVRPGSKLKVGRVIEVAPELSVEVLEVTESGDRVVQLHTPLPLDEALERFGEIPLPPYVKRPADSQDRERYQTVYARTSGSVAAPTAGLHFTPEILGALEDRGVALARLLLYVGVGTFRPVEVEDPAGHRMHSERYAVSEATAAEINLRRAAGGAIWAVGTTTVRTLESVTDEAGVVQFGEGWTDIFIRPPHRLRGVDRMITNFHLPRSTLLMLVAAFAGYHPVMHAYAEAIALRYRFYSYGDAMAIV